MEQTEFQELVEYYRSATAKFFEPGSLVPVALAQLKEETRCPICYGTIKNARVAGCLHRYCSDCIGQCLRAEIPGRPAETKECPVCRAHLGSRRAAREDPLLDAIVQALYGDVLLYEAEEEKLIDEDVKRVMKLKEKEFEQLRLQQKQRAASFAKAPRRQANSDIVDLTLGEVASAGNLADESGKPSKRKSSCMDLASTQPKKQQQQQVALPELSVEEQTVLYKEDAARLLACSDAAASHARSETVIVHLLPTAGESCPFTSPYMLCPASLTVGELEKVVKEKILIEAKHYPKVCFEQVAVHLSMDSRSASDDSRLDKSLSLARVQNCYNHSKVLGFQVCIDRSKCR